MKKLRFKICIRLQVIKFYYTYVCKKFFVEHVVFVSSSEKLPCIHNGNRRKSSFLFLKK